MLPEGLDGLYIGGGYPEEYAEALARNTTMLESVRRFAGEGKLVYAECGGLMYLAQGIECGDAARHKLVGLLPQWTRMLDRRKALSYVEVTLTRDSLFGKQGERLRGHEFHYSELLDHPIEDGGWNHPYSVKRRRSDAAVTGRISERQDRGELRSRAFRLSKRCGTAFCVRLRGKVMPRPGQS